MKKKNNFPFFDKLNNKEFDLIYLLGSDNIEIKKDKEFIIYQGSHGDRGAGLADIILPSPAYTEQSGLYMNVEGRVQECNKASYPAGKSLEEWKVFNLILKKLDKNSLKNFDFLRQLTKEKIINFNGINKLPENKIKDQKYEKVEFFNEKINIKEIDYYFSNAISRSSKTMSDCKKVINKEQLNGTKN